MCGSCYHVSELDRSTLVLGGHAVSLFAWKCAYLRMHTYVGSHIYKQPVKIALKKIYKFPDVNFEVLLLVFGGHIPHL